MNLPQPFIQSQLCEGDDCTDNSVSPTHYFDFGNSPEGRILFYVCDSCLHRIMNNIEPFSGRVQTFSMWIDGNLLKFKVHHIETDKCLTLEYQK